MAVKFGVFVPQGWRLDLTEIADPVAQFEAMTAVANVVDADPAWDAIWIYDHFHTVPRPELETTFECWTITATLARDTKRVRIGQMVGCNGYRNPALLAKMISTIDVASHGRLNAGIGAGWYEEEWRAYGYGFPDIPERMRMFREGVEILHKMWTEEYPAFSGRYYTINRPINEPKGVQKPHPPLWIGGGGEQVTLKLVAQYGDACNVGGGNPETIRQKLEILRRHCDAVGRDYDSIIKSTSINLLLLERDTDYEVASAPVRATLAMSHEEFSQAFWVGGSDEIAARLQPVIDAGIDYVIFYMPRLAYDQRPLHQFAAEIAPRFA
ncbi:MAG: LLM class F420-dependent oxidoreductase [Thermomicrobiales bacterium]